MIDVVMCLIVFYLVVGKLAADQRAELRLPGARSGETRKGAESLVINVASVDAAGAEPRSVRIAVDGEEIAAATVPSMVRKRVPAGGTVRVRASRDLAYGDVAPVIEACRDAGVGSVRLATEKVP